MARVMRGELSRSDVGGRYMFHEYTGKMGRMKKKIGYELNSKDVDKGGINLPGITYGDSRWEVEIVGEPYAFDGSNRHGPGHNRLVKVKINKLKRLV